MIMGRFGPYLAISAHDHETIQPEAWIFHDREDFCTPCGTKSFVIMKSELRSMI
jgi:hypothetical protein